MSQTWLFAPPTHANHVTGTHHPETAARTTRIIRALEQDVHVQTACRWGTPRPATTDELARVHTPDHLARVAEAGRAAQARQQLVALDPDTVMSAGSYEAAGDAAGAVLAAVEAIHQGKARRAFVVARPPGHHATPNRAMGFCLFNNVAVGARHAQHLGFQRVLIVDWDVHHGNGTQDIFYADPSVFFFPSTSFRTIPVREASGNVASVRAKVLRSTFHYAPERRLPRIWKPLKPGWKPLPVTFTPTLCSFRPVLMPTPPIRSAT